MTYAELTTSIQNWLIGDDQAAEAEFVAEIPTFVKNAEEYIYNRIRVPNLRKTQYTAFTASNRFLTIPSDFLASYSLRATTDATGAYSDMILKDPSYITTMYPIATVTGTPKFYGIWDNASFLIGPTPSSGLTAELTYYFRPETIVTASTTWLGTNWGGALLYRCLVEGYTFQKGNPEAMGHYKSGRDEFQMLLDEYGLKKVNKDDYRDGRPGNA